MAAFRNEKKCPDSFCSCFSCVCRDTDGIVAVLRSPEFRKRYGELIERCVTKDWDFCGAVCDEEICKIRAEASMTVFLRRKIPEYSPIEMYTKPLPLRHSDILKEKHGYFTCITLKDIYNSSREEMARLDKAVWKERTKYVKECEEKYLAALLNSKTLKGDRKKELYKMTLVVLVDYIVAEAGKRGDVAFHCAIHGIRALTPFVDQLGTESLEKVLRLFEDDRHYIPRELCTLVLCWINHPQHGMALADTLGKMLLQCTEDRFSCHAMTMKEIFWYVCPIPGVHMTVAPDVFSTLIKYHCIALTLSHSRNINKQIVENLKIACAFDSLPIVEKAYDSGRIPVETFSDLNLITFMTDVGYPICQDDPKVKRAVDRQKELAKKTQAQGVRKEFVDVSMIQFMKKLEKEEKKWTKLARGKGGLEERKKDMELLADCMTKSVDNWIKENGDKITSPFLKKSSQPKKRKKKKPAASGAKNTSEENNLTPSSTKQGGGKAKDSEKVTAESSSKGQDETSKEQVPENSETFKVKQLQRCGYCNRQELPEAKFQKCARCRKTRYCCKECQQQHWWEGHKDVCKEKKSEGS